MGTKMALRSPGFQHLLVSRQLRLSLSCAVPVAVVLALAPLPALFGSGNGPAVTPFVALVALVALAVTAAFYVRRAGDQEDEAIGLVDVTTLPRHVRAPASDESARGD